MSHRRLLILWIAFVVLAGPARAQEPDTEPDTDQRPADELIVEDNAKHKAAELSVYARIGSQGAFGPGVQLAVPVVPRGFIDSLNDAFFLEFGVDFMWVNLILPGFSTSPYLEIAPMGGVKWVFYITPAFEAFTSIKGGAHVSSDSSQAGAMTTPLFEWTFGGNVRLSRQFAIRFEVGYPAVRIGLSIAFE